MNCITCDKKVKIVIFSLLTISTISIFFAMKYFSKEDINDLINITTLSEEFMEEYFEEYNELEVEEKENMLIVISSETINEEEYGASKVVEGPNNKYYLTFDDDVTRENAINQLSNEEFVKSVEENITRKVLVTENSTSQNNEKYNSWGIQAMGLNYAMNTISNLGKNEVTVAIIDTGLDVNLFNKYYSGRLKNIYNVLDEEESTSMYDNFGHGTHIAGTIAEGTPANVKIIPIKVSDNEELLNTDILAALEYVIYYSEVDVINMSFGSYQYSYSEYQLIEAAKRKNIIAVAAAGNDNTSLPMYPAAYDNTISIASVDSNLEKSYFSNYGNTITFAAPGGQINSIMASYMRISENADGDDDHETISGTSMATPHAVSAVAILKSINKEITLENTIELLKNKTIDLGGKDYDIYYGNGLINYNDVEFCTNEEMSCDEFNIFKVIKPINMTIDEVTYTTYNYGSLSNIMGTKVYFDEADGLDYTKELWELDDLTITGYDPYNNEEQTIIINYLDLELSVKVKNPDNYESGWEYQLYNEKYYLSNYKDNGLKIGKLYLPEKIDGLTISGILDSNDLSSVLFSNSDDSNYFEEIILPSNIIYIGSYAFDGLPKCTQVISKANEINVNSNSFSNMPNLTTIEGNIVFSETSYYVFENDSSLQNITISENTSNILPMGAFSRCASLNSFTLPNNITTIGVYAFLESGLVSIDLPNNLKNIKDQAFAGSNLESVILPESLEKIEFGAFFYNNLESISIPKNVNLIHNTAFSNNYSLNSIIVDEENEFYDSRNNSNLIIETSTNKVIQGSNNATIPSSVVTIGENSFEGIYIKELNVSEGVTTIEKNAFIGADFLEKIVLPNSLTNIHSSVFSYYQNIDEQKLLGASTSGSLTGIGETALWVNKDSYSYEFAVNNNNTYVIIGDSSDFVRIDNIMWLLKKSIFYPGDKIDEYIDWIKYNNDIFSPESGVGVENFTVEYQNGDSVSLDDFYVVIKFNLEHSYQNIKLRIHINVVEGKSDIELPVIEAVLGDYVCNYEFPEGTFSPYKCTSFMEPGKYTLLGDYTLKSTGETHYSVEVSIRVLDKVLVNNFAQHILAKTYDGTATLDPDNVILYSYYDNLLPSDYTIVSAELVSPNVSNKTLVKIKARINDSSYEKFAFSGNKQEIEFTGYTAVLDFEIPTSTLLIGEDFCSIYLENGYLSGYGSNSFEEAGDYIVIGAYYYNDGSTSIDDIAIPVHVINKRIVHELAEITPKEYDGTTNIDFDTIELYKTDKSKYTILSAQLESPNVSDWGTVKLKIKLNDSFYENYAFTGNKQESEWLNYIKVIQATPKYHVPTNLTAKLGQKLSEVSLPDGFEWINEDEILDEIGKKTYKAKYIPKDTNNYKIVEDIDITIDVLDNAIEYTASDYSGIYDGKEHSINIDVNLTDYKIKYSINNTEYNLNELPKFKEVGEYTINYKITKEGYKDIIGSNKVNIYGIKGFDSSLIVKNGNILIKNNNYSDIIHKINTHAIKTEYSHYDKDNKLVDNGIVRTGDILKIKLNGIKDYKYTLGVIGDVSGDGAVNSADLLRMRQHLIGTQKSTGVYYLAADITDDYTVNSADLLRLRQHLLGTKPIS